MGLLRVVLYSDEYITYFLYFIFYLVCREYSTTYTVLMYSNVYLLEYFNKHFATRGCLLFSNVYNSVNSAISFPILFSSANCTPLQLAETRPIDYTCMHIFIWVPAHILAEERSSKSLRRSWVTKVTGVTRWRRTRIKRAQAAVGSTSSAARHCSVTSWAKAPVSRALALVSAIRNCMHSSSLSFNFLLQPLCAPARAFVCSRMRALNVRSARHFTSGFCLLEI